MRPFATVFGLFLALGSTFLGYFAGLAAAKWVVKVQNPRRRSLPGHPVLPGAADVPSPPSLDLERPVFNLFGVTLRVWRPQSG
ncbi:hypothetical protein PJL15_00356 [Paenarthrobacter nitroguajacolicus]|nr:hypothetical protein [Paenarthrobacter nitroguajacolicus]